MRWRPSAGISLLRSTVCSLRAAISGSIAKRARMLNENVHEHSQRSVPCTRSYLKKTSRCSISEGRRPRCSINAVLYKVLASARSSCFEVPVPNNIVILKLGVDHEGNRVRSSSKRAIVFHEYEAHTSQCTKYRRHLGCRMGAESGDNGQEVASCFESDASALICQSESLKHEPRTARREYIIET